MPTTATALRAALKTFGILVVAYLCLAWAGLSRLGSAVLSVDWWRVAPYTAAAPLSLSAFLAMAFALRSEWGNALLWTAITLSSLITCFGLHQYELLREELRRHWDDYTVAGDPPEYIIDRHGLHVIPEGVRVRGS